MTQAPAPPPTPAAEQHDRLVLQLQRTFGRDLNALFHDPAVVEIMLNPDGQLFVEKHGVGIEQAGEMSAAKGETIISLVASSLRTTATRGTPIVEGAMPDEFRGARFEGLLPPLVRAPSFAIRLPARVIYTLDNYAERGIATAQQIEMIRAAVRERRNILVAGGTGSGKTTLLNAVLAEIADQAGLEQRIVMIEDTAELQCAAQNVVSIVTTDTISMTRALKATMRLRPDRIVVGEVRDGAALALLKAWNTGHPGGAATVHANNPQAALLRIDQLTQEAGVPSQSDLIREAIDLVVQIARDPSTSAGRRITDVQATKAERVLDRAA